MRLPAAREEFKVCRTLVLHADDFGLNGAITAGILRGFEHGLLTSTALLANAPNAAAAIDAWKQLESRHATCGLASSPRRKALHDAGSPFDLGVHLNLTQGRPLTGKNYPGELLDQEGRFPGIFRLFWRLQRRGSNYDSAIRAELSEQIAYLVDRGWRPTHLNGHQYVELIPQVARVIPDLLAKFNIPAVRVAVEPGLHATILRYDGRLPAWLLAIVKRHFAGQFLRRISRGFALYPPTYFGTAHAGRIDARLVELFLRHAPGDGMIEIAFHPAVRGDHRAADNRDGWLDPLASRRVDELKFLESDALASLIKARDSRLGRLSGLTAA